MDNVTPLSSEAASTCTGAVAGSIFGTIVCILLLAIGAWWLYKKYWKSKSESPLVADDAENAAKVDYAFDNPAFKGDNNKNVSPFDNKWKTPEKRKTVDDSYTNTPLPRLVPLRGSDFTGLGIEVCGGLKDGIYVKKVMPQGPAANIVNCGDKITSITIDFRHIVQEDAMTILSYASPYNVQLEVIEGKGTLPTTLSQNLSQQQSLTHPLYRSSSQEDFDTIERNARKKLFTNGDTSYPTLKMEQQQQQPTRSTKNLPQAHEEHEKKNSLQKIQNYFIDMVEEKFQTKSSHSGDAQTRGDGKKSMKFGIRVLPPNVNDKEFGKSPSKMQADNENNVNTEMVETMPPPPEAMKRSKNKSGDKLKMKAMEEANSEFVRQASINSSGIKRDAAGIPQEMPAEMMQAALSARDNRKMNSNSIERKSKGKAPRPPQDEDSEMGVTSISIDMTDTSIDAANKLHFSDNFNDSALNSSTPMKTSNATEIQIDQDSDPELSGKGAKQIELNSKHITIHQASEEDSSEERRAASLGDLSKLELNTCPTGSNNGTLERAQSLEMSDPNNQIAAGKVVPKKRKAQLVEHVEETDYKEPRLSEPVLENLEALQSGRLKSAYEWGKLEDAIYDGKDKGGNTSETESMEALTPHKKLSAGSMDMMSEVLAAADKFDREINDIKLTDVMEDVTPIELEIPQPNVNEENGKVEVVPRQTSDSTPFDANSNLLEETRRFIKAESEFFIEKPINGLASMSDAIESEFENATTHKKPVSVDMQIKAAERTNGTDNGNDNEQLKIMSYDSNMPDDVKVSRYPLGNLVDRPKSQVLKQLIAQQLPDEQVKVINGITLSEETITIDPMTSTSTMSTTTTFTEIGPISLTLGNHQESDLTESSQISPVFSSDDQGVNSISISSNESASPTAPIPLKTSDNVVTISTDDSQPSSIIMIDDENINFTLRTLDDEPKIPSPAARTTLTSPVKDEVFIIESLSSKKVHDSTLPATNNANSKDLNGKPPSPTKSFITEIHVANSNKDKQMNAKNLSKSMDGATKPSTPAKTMTTTTLNNNVHSTTNNNNNNHNINNNNNNNNNNDKSATADEEYIPRNSEIRFTTSTYQSPRSFSNDNKHSRHSHIDQIRSTFERSHTSEIPVPIRKISTPSTPPPQSHHNNNQSPASTVTRVSPSKIPVFNSQKSSDNLLKNSSVNHNANRVSVSVTSIKNSSRNPSGK